MSGIGPTPNSIAALPRGKDHWAYNPTPGKKLVHRRLYKKVGKATAYSCADCGRRALDWSNETGIYDDDPENYKPRCRSCHVKKDKNWLKKEK